MKSIEKKREEEKKVVSLMISLYCKKKHKHRGGLCSVCAELDEYARKRAQSCPFMETKTFCSKCKVHCYTPKMRDEIIAVMKFSGPRMLMHHPVMAVKHLISK